MAAVCLTQHNRERMREVRATLTPVAVRPYLKCRWFHLGSRVDDTKRDTTINDKKRHQENLS